MTWTWPHWTGSVGPWLVCRQRSSLFPMMRPSWLKWPIAFCILRQFITTRQAGFIWSIWTMRPIAVSGRPSSSVRASWPASSRRSRPSKRPDIGKCTTRSNTNYVRPMILAWVVSWLRKCATLSLLAGAWSVRLRTCWRFPFKRMPSWSNCLAPIPCPPANG